jgi:hypothetical protein
MKGKVMNDAAHRHVPVGTIADHEGEPVTVRRDYSHGLIPEMELTVAGVDQLAAILPDLRAQMVAAKAEEAEDEAERLAHEAWRDGEDGDLCGAEWWPPRNGDGSYGEPPQYCDQPTGHDGDHGASGGTSWPQDNDEDSGRDRARFGRSVQ